MVAVVDIAKVTNPSITTLQGANQ